MTTPSTDGEPVATATSVSETRRVTLRANEIATTTPLSDRAARAVAYAECGYSESGIASKLDCAEKTAHAYLERAVAHCGWAVAWPTPEERREPVAELTRAEFDDAPHELRGEYLAVVGDHEEYAPDWAVALAGRRGSQ